MNFKHHIEEGKLVFEGLNIGNLITGEKLDWDTLRHAVIIQTRFATGREIKPRSLDKLVAEIKDYVVEKSASIDNQESKTEQKIKEMQLRLKKMETGLQGEVKQLKTDLHNAWRFVATLEDKIGEQNKELNEQRKQYYEMARALPAPSETA